jgi:hypothetical protein
MYMVRFFSPAVWGGRGTSLKGVPLIGNNTVYRLVDKLLLISYNKSVPFEFTVV